MDFIPAAGGRAGMHLIAVVPVCLLCESNQARVALCWSGVAMNVRIGVLLGMRGLEVFVRMWA